MSYGRPDDRRGVGLLWLVAAVGTGVVIWAACTNVGEPSYRTCSAVPASPVPATSMVPATSGVPVASPAAAVTMKAVAMSVPWAASGLTRATAVGELACSG